MADGLTVSASAAARIAKDRADWAALAAAADPAEAVDLRNGAAVVRAVEQPAARDDPAAVEHERMMRLARWQAQR